MKKISIRNLGPIKEADITFGDLTILVGPQASGKSIFLQLVKLVSDTGVIHDRLKKHGYVWENSQALFELFFGEGMSQVWNKATKVSADDVVIDRNSLLNADIDSKQTVFYIPAQRVIALQNGWPRPFSDFTNEPYVLKGFSEALRATMDQTTTRTLFGKNDSDSGLDYFYKSVYYNGRVELDIKSHRKRFILNIGGSTIPYMAWSAGQREFMPLWAGMNFVFSSKSGNTRTIIIEEPEMGLHPAAVKNVVIKLLELIRNGYKVIISTHSPIFLEFAWAFKFLQSSKVEDKVLYELFDADVELPVGFFDGVMNKNVATYYFDKTADGVTVKDISTLDAGSEDPLIAEWGGLSSFASKAGEIVAKYGPDEE